MSGRRKFNILVAEDEVYQRLTLIDYMELCNYDCLAVENGKLALEQLQNPDNYFDLLLLDLHMPDMDGFELL